MKYIDSTYEQLDSEIERIIEHNLPKSAFKRIIPANIKEDLRRQYSEYLAQKSNARQMSQSYYESSRPVPSRVIKVNISALRKAGYCICPEELSAACQMIIRNPSQFTEVKKQSEMNILTENIHPVSKNESNDSEPICDHETTHSKSNDLSSDNSDVQKTCVVLNKAYPTKTKIEEFSNKKNSGKSHHAYKTKRKYFTKYMSKEFSKDVQPVTMSMMDDKTQSLFKEREYNDLVSEITGLF